MAHNHNEAAEAILDKAFPVLDHGFVRMVDYMGGDSRVVQAARVSYGAGTKTIREDKGLIDYLMRHQHTSPFEMVSITFHCKMPIFVARQWVRHRTAKLNEISGRYSEMKPEYYVPAPKRITRQSTSNKQGSSDEMLEHATEFHFDFHHEQQEAHLDYEEKLKAGMAKELARINLPLSLYTEWYWTMDLHNLFHFLALRLDHHAQYEIRVYAEAMLEIVRAVAPLATEAFEKHIRNGVRLSKDEVEILVGSIDWDLLDLAEKMPEHEKKIAALKGKFGK